MPNPSRSSAAEAARALQARQVASRAGLVYVSDDQPGIARRRAGKGFGDRLPDGRAVRDAPTLQRIRQLYTQVWICTEATGHPQATGRDARRRKQYRYHPDWAQMRGAGKFERIMAFGKALPRLRLRRDLALHRLPAREGPGAGGGADGRDPGARRQRRIRAQQPLLWPDHAAQPSPGIRQGRRKAYIDPCVFDGWRGGTLHGLCERGRGERQWDLATLNDLAQARAATARAAGAGKTRAKTAGTKLAGAIAGNSGARRCGRA
jgi:hypothetical protein